MTDRCLDLDQAAEYLGVKRRWLADRCGNRSIPHTRLGRKIRFTPADIRALEAQFREPVRNTLTSARVRRAS